MLSIINNSTYTMKTITDVDNEKTVETKNNIAVSDVDVVFYDVTEDGDLITNPNQVVSTNPAEWHTVKLRFVIGDITYFAYFMYTGYRRNRTFTIDSIKPGCQHEFLLSEQWILADTFTTNLLKDYPDVETKEINGEKYVKVVEDLSHKSDLVDADEFGNHTNLVPVNLRHILVPKPSESFDSNFDGMHTVGFLSYTFDEANFEDEVNVNNIPLVNVKSAYYLNDAELYKRTSDDNVKMPVDDSAKNIFIITSNEEWNKIEVGHFVKNIAYYNQDGVSNKYKIIPGITRIIDKRFVPFIRNNKTGDYEAVYHGVNYPINMELFTPDKIEKMKAMNGAIGFYVYTAIDPVKIEEETDNGNVIGYYIARQLPLTHDTFSHNLRFIPMKGLKITSKHRPGYDENGDISIEGGIKKIYSVLEDTGIQRGLCNEAMVDYRYIVDSMSYGLDTGLGGKVYLSRLAENRGKTLAVLNMPSAKQFAVSANPVFCDSYTMGIQTRPSFDTKYIPTGGNQEMGSSKVFSLPDEANGSKYSAAFWPNLIYSENGKKISVPPAADVCNVLASKFTGLNSPYAINANTNGIIRNRFVTGVEFDADVDDRGYLEPMGVNTIIRDQGSIMIYGNQTCYQTLKSDLNKLHIRETLNTIEIECTAQLKQFNFLYNTASTRAAIVQTLTPILQVMQISGAIDTFTITCDESNNTPEIIEGDYGIVDIDVWFNHGMEKILTRIKINRYGTQNNSDSTTAIE